jgi:hypothetical protein
MANITMSTAREYVVYSVTSIHTFMYSRNVYPARVNGSTTKRVIITQRGSPLNPSARTSMKQPCDVSVLELPCGQGGHLHNHTPPTKQLAAA